GAPASPIVERNVYTDFRCGIKQSFALGILADRAHCSSRWQISADPLPTLAEVSSLECVGCPVVGLMAIHGDICGPRIEVSCFDQADAAVVQNWSTAGIREILGRHICPVLSAIRRDVNQTIVAAGPDRP